MSNLTPVSEGFYKPIQQEFLDRSGLDEATFKREASFAMQIMEKNSYLQSCDPNSILKAVLNVAQTGLTLNPISKYAYLVPRAGKCILDPSYTGLVKLLTDSGAVTSINCQLVFEGDDIEIDLSSEKKIKKHVPYLLTGKEQGKIKMVYSVATLHDGSFHAELMSWKDIEEIRARSEAYKSYVAEKTKTCIWIDHAGEMTRKTCIKRHFKHLPKSGNLEPFEKAIELSHVAGGFTEEVSHHQIGYIEALIPTANLSEQEKSDLEMEIPLIEYSHQARKMIDFLKSNQQILGLERFPANATEVKELSKSKADQDG